MHQLLHRRPIHVFEIGPADAYRLVHLRRAQGNIELQIVVVWLHLLQIWQWSRILPWPVKPEWFQRLACDHPRTDRGGKRLGLKWPERHILPLLDIARAPATSRCPAGADYRGATVR